ncbi:MAG: hypothetical protein QN130_12280 [Armatimonadota bacterium]|nr:hypothetical protein [Armatimonadota bacterium]
MAEELRRQDLEPKETAPPTDAAPPAEAAPKPEEPDPETVKRVLKAALGVEDIEQVKRRLAEADLYEEALLQAPPPARRPAATPPARPEAEDDEEELARLARLDPWAALKRWEKRRLTDMAKMAALAEQRAAKRAEMLLAAREAAARLQAEWPEAYDPSHELYRTAAAVYHREMTPQERALPHSFYVATERAAARLGLPPRSRRTTHATATRATEARAQSVSGRAARPPEKEAAEEELTPEERRRIEIMGITPEVYRKAKAARKAGRNVRVED